MPPYLQLIIIVVALVVTFKRPSAVWGGLTGGALLGLIWATVSASLGNAFHWSTIGNAATIGALLGVAAELLGAAGDRLRKT